MKLDEQTSGTLTQSERQPATRETPVGSPSKPVNPDSYIDPHGSSTRDLVLAGAVVAGLAFLYAPTAAWLIDRWTLSVWHNLHGMFVPPIVGYLVWHELRDTRALPRSASALGFVLLGPALFILALDAGMHTQLLSAFSLVLLMPGLSLLFLGIERTRRVAFPLAFLMFMLPIPLSFTQQLHLALREISTAGSTTLVSMMGIPVFTEATTVHLAGATLQVADSCSGFSTLYASMAVACLVAYMNPSLSRRTAVLIVAAPVAIGANVLRVTLLILLVMWQGQDILDTSLHTISGMLTFAAALPIILWVGRDPEASA